MDRTTSSIGPPPPPRRADHFPPPPVPLTGDDLRSALRQPLRLADVVLGMHDRIAQNLTRGEVLWPLALCLTLAAIAFAVPFGFVHGWGGWWKVVPLYLGSTLICVPALHVFSSYLGVRTSPERTVALAMCLPATAALFTFGFAPILGFLRATMGEGSDYIGWQTISSVLLMVALVAGVGQLWRCFLASRTEWKGEELFRTLLLAWHVVLLAVMARMATVLGFWA